LNAKDLFAQKLCKCAFSQMWKINDLERRTGSRKQKRQQDAGATRTSCNDIQIKYTPKSNLLSRENRKIETTCGRSSSRGFACASRLFVWREREREFKDLILDKNPQVELEWILVALKPHDARGFAFWREGLLLQHGGLVLQSFLRKIIGGGRDVRGGLVGGARVRS